MTLPRGLDQSSYITTSARRELDAMLPILAGSSNDAVRRVQEYLVLSGFNVVIDGDFGPATTSQLKAFQEKNGMPVTGVYEVLEHDALCGCFVRAVSNRTISDRSAPSSITSIAAQHVRERPREVGGENRGPWVRLYMDGHDGPAYLWCAGFCFFILDQAFAHLGLPSPMQKTFSVDVIVERAKNSRKFLDGDTVAKDPAHHQVAPGSLFVVRESKNSWSHVGIVREHDGDVIHTFEGNTNDDGSSNGYEAIERVRNIKGKDFVIWS